MRLHLTLALITIVALVFTLRAAHKHHFSFTDVDNTARHRAITTFVAPPDSVPAQLKKLKPAEENGIYAKETSRMWRKKGLPFQIDFYPQLNTNPLPHFAPVFSWVDGKGTHDLPYSNAFFNFLDKSVKPPRDMVFNPPLPPDIGYAGFYLRYPDMAIGSNPGSLDGFFSALGASYFRAIAKDQVYGLSGRGIAINTSLDDPKIPEEFPLFTNWWLHEPGSNSTEVVIDALMDGPSVTGAYEFKIRPGAMTSVDVHASLYFRNAVQRLGLCPFSSMYLYGENSYDHFGDSVHPEVHDSDGLLIQNNHDEWNWRPLAQSDDKRTDAKGYQLQDYEIQEENPKGFGLIQRDRDFTHYQDPLLLYNVRPSIWIIPRGDWGKWGKGTISLIQRPSDDFNTDNVVLFWHPTEPIKAGDHIDINYTIDFYMNDAERPPLAYVKQTLINCPAPDAPPPPPTPAPAIPPPKPGASTTNAASAAANSTAAAPKPGATPPQPTVLMGPPAPPKGPPIPVGTKSVQFVIDFVGAGIENIPANQPPEIDLGFAPPGTYLRDKSIEKIGYDHSWRVTFTIIPFKHFVVTDLRCRLMRDGKALTETWDYTWRQ